jgi:hypothetical protein
VQCLLEHPNPKTTPKKYIDDSRWGVCYARIIIVEADVLKK